MIDDQVCSVAQKLSDRNTEIPSLSTGSSQLIMRMMDNDIGVQEVLFALERYLVVVGKLISLANSTWSNPTVEVTTLDAACTRLGLDVVRRVAIALVVGRLFEVLNCPVFDRTRFWASSIVTSEIATALAPHFNLDDMSARAAGLLQNVGLLWLADRLPSEANAALSAVQSEPNKNVTEQFERHCGIGYMDAGFILVGFWASSIVTSEITTALAPHFNLDDMSARAAGLLQNVGLLWLADRLPSEANAALSAVQSEPNKNVTEQFERHCGIGYMDAGFILLTHWQLPDILVAGTRVLEDSSERELHLRMNTLISISADIASRVCAGDEDFECDSGLEQEAELLNVFQEQRSKLPSTLEMVNAIIRT